jgi:hypothetical protein
MSNLNLSTIIEELLLRDGFVAVPKLGGFFLRESNSSINSYTFELKPRTTQIIFNSELADDDGLLIHCIKKKTGLSYKESQEWLSNEIESLKSQLAEKKIASLSPLGNLIFNETSGVFFIPKHQINLHHKSFGLKPIKWHPFDQIHESAVANPITISSKIDLKLASTSDADVIEVSHEHISRLGLKNQSNLVWRIAASFVLVSITAGLLLYNSQNVLSHLENNHVQAGNDVLVGEKKSNTDSIVVISEPTFINVNGKLINIGKSISTKPNLVDSSKDIVTDYRNQIFTAKGNYFIIAGSHLTKAAAQIECDEWQKQGMCATYIKVKGSSLLKVVLNRFSKAQQASKFLQEIKEIPSKSVSIQEIVIIK